ncbi:hypothetical protein DIPPA_02763 [Diplonema papillatum]|nr:hypothetical protein DIPPA_02763 [Diplonema papillatum]
MPRSQDSVPRGGVPSYKAPPGLAPAGDAAAAGVQSEGAIVKPGGLRRSGDLAHKGRVLFENVAEPAAGGGVRSSKLFGKNVEGLQNLFSKEADEASKRALEWTPDMGLPGMDFDIDSVERDSERGTKVLEMLQALDRTAEELMAQKVSNEELMGFLEMGEKRVVDLAIKVKLLEDQNDKLAHRESAQAHEIESLRASLADTASDRDRLSAEKDIVVASLGALDADIRELRIVNDTLLTEKEREVEANHDLRRTIEAKDDSSRREKEKLLADQRVQHTQAERERRLLHERMEDWRKKADVNSAKNKQLETAVKDKTREAEKLSTEFANLQRSYKNEKVKMESELSNGKMHIQEELIRLHAWDKELAELAEKLKKNEANLDKEKSNIKKAICGSVREIQDQREAENRLLTDLKQQYEEELQLQFEAKQNELDEHWRQTQSAEIDQLDERRNALESEVAMKVQKANENRQRLEKYSQNLEKYARRLKSEYDSWQGERAQVYAVIDEAQREREEAEEKLKVEIQDLKACVQQLYLEVGGKKAAVDSISAELEALKTEKSSLMDSQHESGKREISAERHIDDLLAENERLIEDNTVLEKNFNELRYEHDQLLEEMTFLRTREDEERELRRKTNEVLLATYRVNPAGRGATASARHAASLEGADVLRWHCQNAPTDEEGDGLLSRAREARRELRVMTEEQNLLRLQQGEEALHIRRVENPQLKAAKLDTGKLLHEAGQLQKQREAHDQATQEVQSQRKALGEAALSKHNVSTTVDPDFNPVCLASAPKRTEPPAEASLRRKKDLLFLKSMYSAPSNDRSSLAETQRMGGREW